MNMFEGITEFVAVAETQGFTSAGKRLGVSTSHVSRQLSELENKLGIALVARTTRQVRLTNAGQMYYERCIDLINGIEQANEIVTAGQVQLSGQLRVTAAGEYAESYVVPELLEFVNQHPELTLEVDYNTRLANFVEDNFDFAIRFGTLPDSSLIARKLTEHDYMAVASPKYLSVNGVPDSPQSLVNHSCIVSTYNKWVFEDKGQDIMVNVPARIRVNSPKTIVNACLAGLGIAYMPKTSFGDTLSKGKLVPVLDSYWKNRGATWIVFANRKFLPARARLAIDYLCDRFQS